LSNETVVIFYSLGGISTWTPIASDLTDGLGNYYMEWIPPATGSFATKAEWEGNSTHLSANTITNLNTLPYEEEYIFSVESNSTISELTFEPTSSELSFIVSGPSGTTGYVDAYVAKTLIGNISEVEVDLNGEEINHTTTSLDDSWLIHFTYQHTTHSVTINLGSIPGPFIEIPIEILVTMFLAPIITSAIIILYFWKKKQSLTIPVPKGRVRMYAIVFP
jgi:hypothetical protein